MPIAVTVENVSKKFRLYDGGRPSSLKERIVNPRHRAAEDFWALREVSFDVPEGVGMGLLGHNGSGKSTILKCMAGVLRPTSGSITVRGRVAALLELGSGFHPELSGTENIFLNGSILGFSRVDMEKRLEAIVDFADINPQFLDVPIKRYSSGMAARLGFAVAIQLDPEVLIVDEVFAVGDEAFQAKCLVVMNEHRDQGRTTILVTHDAPTVANFCSVAGVLDHGELVAFGDPVDAVAEFRKGMAAQGAELRPEATVPVRHDTHEIVIERVEIDLDDRDRLLSGESLTVRVGLEAETPIDDVIVAFAISDAHGHVLLSTNTDVIGTPLAGWSDRGEVVFTLDQVPLLPGRYDVSIGVHNRLGTREYHRIHAAAEFVVSGTSPLVGTLNCDVTAVAL